MTFPSSSSHFPTLFRQRWFAALLYILAAVFIFVSWVWSADTRTTSFNGDPRSTLSGLIYGTAHKPYVQRAFVPFATRIVHAAVPEETWNSIEGTLLAIPKIAKESARLGWENDFLAEYLVALLIVFGFVLGLPFAIRQLWESFYHTSEEITNLIPLAVMTMLPPFFATGPHYVYDFPALLLFTLGLVFLLRRNWTFFYPLFIIGCLNKETMVLLTLVFVVLFKTSPRTIWLHAGLQLALFALIRIALAALFAGNPGPGLEFHAHANVHTFALGYSWTSLLALCATLWLIFHDFSVKPSNLRKIWVTTAAAFALLVFVWGVVTELRAVYELVPLTGFLMLHTVFFSVLKLPYAVREIR